MCVNKYIKVYYFGHIQNWYNSLPILNNNELSNKKTIYQIIINNCPNKTFNNENNESLFKIFYTETCEYCLKFYSKVKYYNMPLHFVDIKLNISLFNIINKYHIYSLYINNENITIESIKWLKQKIENKLNENSIELF